MTLSALLDSKLSDRELYRIVHDAAKAAGKLKAFLCEFGTEQEYMWRVNGEASA